MDTIKSFCTEQNQTDYRNFDTGITVIFVMQNLLFWKWWIFPVLKTFGQLQSISYPRLEIKGVKCFGL